MNRIDVALVRVLQFFVFLLFTFMVLTYFGTLLLLPLSVLVQLVRILTFISIPGVISVFLALPVVVYLGYKVYKLPGMVDILISIGLELVAIGYTRVKGFDEILIGPENIKDEPVVSS